MSYNTLITMANDGDLQQRFIAAATVAGVAGPRQWVLDNMLTLANDPDVNATYSSALTAYTQAVAAVPRADIGARNDVVGDNNILAAVNANKPVPATP